MKEEILAHMRCGECRLIPSLKLLPINMYAMNLQYVMNMRKTLGHRKTRSFSGVAVHIDYFIFKLRKKKC